MDQSSHLINRKWRQHKYVFEVEMYSQTPCSYSTLISQRLRTCISAIIEWTLKLLPTTSGATGCCVPPDLPFFNTASPVLPMLNSRKTVHMKKDEICKGSTAFANIYSTLHWCSPRSEIKIPVNNIITTSALEVHSPQLASCFPATIFLTVVLGHKNCWDRIL